nr:tRNA 2-thiouridine(34) synthase MnmA [Dissulfurirhabdus thermomarina]
MSGGVDSAVAAWRLLEAGRRVEGFHLRLADTPAARASREAARAVAARLGIPLHESDLTERFAREVIDPFVAAYRSGRTPNPCVLCNPRIKVAAGLEAADRLGLGAFATGHYARVERREGVSRLLEGRDRAKDQSYFLHAVAPGALPRLCLPLGDLAKTEVRALARRAGLARYTAPESQEICFLRGDYRDFLRERVPDIARPGPVVDVRGRVLGRHDGLYRFTVGQRRGIGLPDATPYYVVRLEPAAHRLVVGKAEDLLCRELTARGVNWLAPPRPGAPARVRIRSRHGGLPARLHPEAGGRVRVRFLAPARAVTPGQFAVFYEDDMVLGGGEICG